MYCLYNTDAKQGENLYRMLTHNLANPAKKGPSWQDTQRKMKLFTVCLCTNVRVVQKNGPSTWLYINAQIGRTMYNYWKREVKQLRFCLMKCVHYGTKPYRLGHNYKYFQTCVSVDVEIWLQLHAFLQLKNNHTLHYANSNQRHKHSNHQKQYCHCHPLMMHCCFVTTVLMELSKLYINNFDVSICLAYSIFYM